MNGDPEVARLLGDHFAMTASDVMRTGETDRALDGAMDLIGRTTQRTGRRWGLRPRLLDHPGTRRLLPALVMVSIGTVGGVMAGTVLPSPPPERMPEPFGLAGNGALVWEHGSDVWTATAEGADARIIVAGASTDTEPRFSHDGSRFSFVRGGDPNGRPGSGDRLMVANADGSDQHQLVASDASIVASAWSPDDRWIAVVIHGPDNVLGVVPADGDGAMRRLDLGLVGPRAVWWRPPFGAELILTGRPYPQNGDPVSLYRVGIDGSGLREIGSPDTQFPLDFAYADLALSPDGATMTFANLHDGVANTWFRDTDTGLDTRPPLRGRYEMGLSPDGTQMLYQVFDGSLPIEGEVLVGPVDGARMGEPLRFDGMDADRGGMVAAFSPDGSAVVGGMVAAFSPDGSKVIATVYPTFREADPARPAATSIIDLATGSRTALPSVTSLPDWQRIAP